MQSPLTQQRPRLYVHWPARFLRLLCLLGLAWVQSGCMRPGSSEGSDDSHEEHFPAHWPASIFNAADRLKQLATSDALEPKNENITVETEWLDLIRWLPELAADSDLTQAQFYEIDGWVTRSLPMLESQYQQGKNLKQLVETEGLLPRIEALVETCRLEQQRLESIK
jgi:hypothetical protein